MLDVRLDPQSAASRAAWSEGTAAVLRLARRDFEKAIEGGDVRAEGRRRNLFVRRSKVRLTKGQLEEVNRNLDALTELLFRYSENTTGELHAVTCVMTPLEERTER